jgi:hypothetical protein
VGGSLVVDGAGEIKRNEPLGCSWTGNHEQKQNESTYQVNVQFGFHIFPLYSEPEFPRINSPNHPG